MRPRRSGFTLLEILISVAVFSIILVIMLSVVSSTSTLTRRANDNISAYQAARGAFDRLAANLSQATLNTYWDYDNPALPNKYLRMSELHFLVGQAGTAPFPGTPGTGQALFFQAPLGVSATPAGRTMSGLLNTCGYFIEYGDTEALPAPFPAAAPRYRYRLMQTLDVSENLEVYKPASPADWLSGKAWISTASAVPIAENVIYLAVWPRKSPADDPQGTALTGTNGFSYNSRLDAGLIAQPATAHQMPPVIQITMVVLDETTAAKACLSSTPPSSIAGASGGLFVTPKADEFAADLEKLQTNLANARLNYRVFSALIAIRESKME